MTDQQNPTTYVVLRPDGEAEAGGLTVEGAADVVLTYDGHDYDIRALDPKYDVEGEQQWQLYVSSGSRASYGGLGEMRAASTGGHGSYNKTISAYARSAAEAWPLLAEMVIGCCGNWRNACTVRTDAEYDAMLAEIAAENDDG